MYAQFMQTTAWLRFASKDDDAMIGVEDSLNKHAGDQVAYGISQLLQSPGVLGLATLTGNEETPLTYADTLYINELAHAVLLVGPISDQRVLYDRRRVAKSRLADWAAARVDHAAAYQLASYTPLADTRYTGLQATIAVSSGRQILPTGITDAANLTVANKFDITMIDRGVLLAKSLTTGIRPLKVGGKDMYVLVMHPSQVTDMRTSTSTGQWLDIQKSAMTGGDIGDNPIFWQAIGMYHGVLMHENARVPNAVANANTAVSNTKRAVFAGAQAGIMAFGRGQGDTDKFRWLEELRDFGRQIGIGISWIWGLKKVVFNSADFGVQVIDTYGLDTDTLGALTTEAQ